MLTASLERCDPETGTSVRKGRTSSAMDWDDLRNFLAVSRHGNLSAAARALGVTQSTMGRRLDSLQDRLGVRLLQKTPSGFVLTAAGARILSDVEHMEATANAVERAVVDEDVRLEGVVRVTTVGILASELLAPSVVDLHRRYPGIIIDLDTDLRALSLSQREADVALRIGGFDQNDVIVRKLGQLAAGIYASPAYIATRGMPRLEDGCTGHHKIGAHGEIANWQGWDQYEQVTANASVVFRCSSLSAQIAAAVAGLGLAGLPTFVADRVPDLVRVGTPQVSGLEVTLGVHRDMLHTPRIRAVVDHIAAVIRRADLSPG